MGLLAALDAPSFRTLFLPEKFLLRALIFKDACQWLPAKRAARALLRRYKSAIDAIHDRQDLTKDAVLSDAALQKGQPYRIERLLEQLRKERDTLDRFAGSWSDSGLQQRLGDLYSLALNEAERRRQVELEKGVVRVADELLSAVEQVNLVDYEVGLALYRRQRGSQASGLTFADPLPKENEVGFEFDGEYWNDELQNLRFVLTDRCVEGVAP